MGSRGDWSGALETYARYSKPQDSLSKEMYLNHDDLTLTIFDGFEKAKFHFLILPRDPFLPPGSTQKIPSKDLLSISKLLKSPHCLTVLETLKVAADKLKIMIEDEMLKRFGFIWPIEVGFHGSESMRHVHLHVISLDLISGKLKNKKHYNSFSPKTGFFLPLKEVIEDFKNGSTSMPSTAHFESILKEPLVSFYNGETYSNIPKLKVHLENEWEKLKKKGLKKIAGADDELEKKRKLDDEKETVGSSSETKKLKEVF